MAISFFSFHKLPLEQQLPLVWRQGTFLAARLVEQQVRTLYHLHTFFCELHYHAAGQRGVVVQFTGLGRLSGLGSTAGVARLPEVEGVLATKVGAALTRKTGATWVFLKEKVTHRVFPQAAS